MNTRRYDSPYLAWGTTVSHTLVHNDESNDASDNYWTGLVQGPTAGFYDCSGWFIS
jgi:hypothetical protein